MASEVNQAEKCTIAKVGWPYEEYLKSELSDS